MQISGSLDLKQPKKTRKGWLGHKVKQIHLRDDIPCGLEYCQKHQNSSIAFSPQNMSSQNLSQDQTYTYIHILDTGTLIQQTDIVYNCAQIKNIIFLQSSIEKLKKNNLNKYNVFKNFVQVEVVGEGPNLQNQTQIQNQSENAMQQENQQLSTRRNYWIFADVYHRQINQSIKNKVQLLESSQKQLTQQQKQWINLLTCAEWYQNHIDQLKFPQIKVKIQILTTNHQYINTNNKQKVTKSQPNPSQGQVQVKSLIQFLKQKNSNLLDFIGFSDKEMQQQTFQQEVVHEEHLPIIQAKKKIKQGKLFQGKYLTEKSYFKIGKDMYKIKLHNNRAFFGDVVAIQLDPIQKWQKRVIKSLQLSQQAQTQKQQNLIKNQQPEQEQNIQIQTNKNIIQLLESNRSLLPTGNIKSVIKSISTSKMYCGSVNTDKVIKQSTNQDGTKWKMFEFRPADDRFPLFYIRTYDVKAVQGKRIQVAYDSWPTRSIYPLCHFVRVIGNIGDIRTQGDVILLEHNVQIKEFSRKAYECLPKQGSSFKISKQQQAYRLDLRNLDVVSIDPPGCKDIDDALHCVQLPNGNLQIGVHIADVSFYVRPDSALDMQARNRCTTVYLVNRRTDMLPKLLTQNLCSLRANVDRLAFSTIWQMDKNANIISTKYCKTIIRSRNAFTYNEAQQLMQSDSKTNIAQSIRNLNRMAKKLKQKRLNEGALTLASTQVKITLQQETHSATDVKLYQMVQANYLIEEFMLLSNIAVAEKIYERFPSISILRRHTTPKVGQLEVLRQILSLYNFQLKYQTSKALADSLDKIRKNGDPFFNKLIRILTTRCMNEATYFCSADFDPQEFYHYGLAAPFYTHFTSPIRRYADILVHRLLAAAIDLQPLPNFMINKIKMTKICDKMNMRNRMARYASRASSDYHTYQYFKQKKGQKQSGIITSINQSSITIMLIKYGMQCKYQLPSAEKQKAILINKGQGIFNLCYLNNKQRKLFEYVDVHVKVQMQGFHKRINIDIL